MEKREGAWEGGEGARGGVGVTPRALSGAKVLVHVTATRRWQKRDPGTHQLEGDSDLTRQLP